MLDEHRHSYIHFPELIDTTPNTPFCSSIARGKHNADVILIHHLHETSLPFIKSVAKGYSIRHIIGIPYSSSYIIANRLKKYADVTIPKSLDDIKYIVMDQIEKSNNNVIIEEIGGYTTQISEFLDHDKRVIGVVEDTKQGQWLWSKSKIKRLPIISIAQSHLKSLEDPYVAKSIIEGVAKFLMETSGKKLKDQVIILLGYGNIGEQVAKFIKPICKDIYVYDNNPTKLSMAARNYKVSRDFSNADIILGTTGNPQHAISQTDIPAIKDGTILISGSSKRIEFDLTGFLNASNKFIHDSNFFTYYFNKKKILVANSGEPINFRYGTLPSHILDLIYGSLIYCMNMIDAGGIPAGLNLIPDDIQLKLISKYNSLYGIDKIRGFIRR